MNKNILIAVTGLSPQVVSETLYALSAVNKIQIDELYIVTTKTGKDIILGKNKNIPPLKSQIQKMCNEYKNINCPKFDERKNIFVAKEESIEISDVKTSKDNKLFPNLITNVIRDKSSNPDIVLYCSLSGGRKTMSAYMGFALSLFARENDTLFHVIVNDEFEKSRKFYPAKKDEKTEIVLSEVPYIKLRGLLPKQIDFKNLTYNSLIDFSQKQIKMLNSILIIDIKNRKLNFRSNSISIGPLFLSVYLFFIMAHNSGKETVSIREMCTKETANEIFNLYCKIQGHTRESFIDEQKFISNRKDDKFEWWNTGLEKPRFRNIRTNTNEKIELAVDDPDVLGNYIIQSRKVYGKTEFYIPGYEQILIVNS
jgi:CRISPR-associated protein (TIGR02584 family)